MKEIENIKVVAVNAAYGEIKKTCVKCNTTFWLGEDLNTTEDGQMIIVSPCKCYECEEEA